MRKYPGENKIAKMLREIRTRGLWYLWKYVGIRASKFYAFFFSSNRFCTCTDKIRGSWALPLIIIPCCPTNCRAFITNDSRLTTSPLLLLVITRCRCWNSNRAINPTEECVDAYARIILIKRTKVCSTPTSALLYFKSRPIVPGAWFMRPVNYGKVRGSPSSFLFHRCA